MVRSHTIFSGRVQGVGFRYSVLRMANEQKLTGWVKNLADGSVELVVEGPKSKIEHLLFKISTQFQITKTDIDWLPSKNQFTDFSVSY